MKSGLRYIIQGEEAVGRRDDDVISTILGSCISICLWDPIARVGGMNHLLLPDSRMDAGPVDTIGAIAMERLINALMRLSADRRRLRAKLFGGSSMLSGMTDVGLRNTEFAITYLQRESIPCDAHSTGGPRARQIRFQPSTGKVKLRFVAEVPEIRPVIAPRQNGVELF